jgi:hypothetical protein
VILGPKNQPTIPQFDEFSGTTHIRDYDGKANAQSIIYYCSPAIITTWKYQTTGACILASKFSSIPGSNKMNPMHKSQSIHEIAKSPPFLPITNDYQLPVTNVLQNTISLNENVNSLPSHKLPNKDDMAGI